jgi:thiol-disulfide isomerase/thioredoxin
MLALQKKTFLQVSFVALLGLAAFSCSPAETPNPPSPTPPVNATPTTAAPVTPAPIGEVKTFTTRIIVEDHTGTWCGHCPRLAKRLDDAMVKYPNVIAIALHNGDKMETPYESALAKINSVVGYPTGVINRVSKWNETQQALEPFLNYQRNLGIGIETSINGNIISGKVKVQNGKPYTSNYKLHIVLVEDKLYYNQSNYGYNNEPNPIVNKEHNDVLRKYVGDVNGEDIPASNQVLGNVYEKSFSFDAKGYNLENCKVIAYVIDPKDGIINANRVIAGKNKAID